MAVTQPSIDWSQLTVPSSIVASNAPPSHIYETIIKGEMLTVNLRVTDYDLNVVADTALKSKMAHMIAEELMKCRFIEFTKMQDMAGGTWQLRARVFVTPDNQVRILRERKVV